MKKILYYCALVLLSSNIFAQYSIDTLFSVHVGPGVIHTKIISPEVPYAINILEVDLTNPYIEMETVKANDQLLGMETVSRMATRKSTEGHRVVGAVNGDFYDMGSGVPTNLQMLDGEIVTLPIPYEVIGFDYRNKPFMDVLSYSGNLITKNSNYSIAGVNTTRGADNLVLYNQYKGAATGTNEFGTELAIEPIDPWYGNDTIRAIIKQSVSGKGNMEIVDGDGVLSGHGAASAFLNSLSVGDTVKIVYNIAPSLPKLKEAIGGREWIVRNGVNVGGWLELHPRTAAGFSQDSTKLYLIVIDGRTSISKGMTLKQLGEFMLRIGNIYQGVNLDGGGSTTMVVNGNVENLPSGGPGIQRAVANGLMVVSTAPQGTLQSVRITPRLRRVFRGETSAINVTGLDEYYNPLTIDKSQLQFSVDENAGKVTSDGTYTAIMRADTGYMHVKYGSYSDSALIIIKDLVRFTVSPQETMTDTTRPVYFGILGYDMDSYKHEPDAKDFTWTVVNPEIGYVDSLGLFHGTKEGTTKVICSYLDMADTSIVHVEVGKGERQLDPMDNSADWIFTGSEVDMEATTLSVDNSVKTAGDASFKIDYRFTFQTGKLNYVYLDPKNQIPVYGIPEFIYVDAKSDSIKHRIFYIVSDDNGELFRVNANKYADRKYAFDTITCPLKTFAPVEGKPYFNYPIKLKRIEVQLSGVKINGTVNTGALYLDNIRVKYPESTTPVGVEAEISSPSDFHLSQNYPNPFNPATVISFNIPESSELVHLRVYDILGREAAVLLNGEMNAGFHKVEWNASDFPSGIYFYRIDAGKYSETKKMMLLK